MSNELLSEELEALTYTFTPEEMTVVNQDPLELLIVTDPRPTDACQERYVRATMSLKATADYPDRPAEVGLQDVKGLNDRQLLRLKQDLIQEAELMRGELMLGHLCDTAKGLLTELNSPDGDCAICLEPLREPEGNAIPTPVQKLPCYHCLHRPCFASWFMAGQSNKNQQRRQLHQDRKHGITQKLLTEQGLHTGSHGLFTLHCPHCREPLDPATLSRAEIKALAEESRSSREGASSGWADLPEDVKQPLLLMRQEQSRLFAVQLSKGGIVPDSYAVAL